MADNENTVVKGLSGLGGAGESNMVQVDLKDGKIVRIRPFHYDWKYQREPWKIEARGQVFEASMKSFPLRLLWPIRIVFIPPIVHYIPL